MALIKKYAEITSNNQEKTLGSGLTGALVNIVICNTGDHSAIVELYNGDGFYYYIKNLGAQSTVAIPLDTSLNDEVLKCKSSQADVYFTANIITE